MPRVNIHLPDALHKRIQEAEINVSAVCQEALEQKISIMEDLKMDDKKLEVLKEKVMKQEEASLHEDFQIGRERAKHLADKNDLDYEDFIAAKNGVITESTKNWLNEWIDARLDEGTYNEETIIKGLIIGINEIGDKLGLKV